MNPRELHNRLALLEHALADLPRDVRQPIDDALNRIVGAYLERWAEVERLRKLHAPESRETLFRRLWEVQPC